MHRLGLSLLVGVCVASAPLHAADELQLPSGEQIGRSLAVICAGQSQGVKVGIAAREAGYPLERVLGSFQEPEDPGVKLVSRGVRSSIQDTYAYPDLKYQTLFFFRSAVCFREVTELRSLPTQESSAVGLRECQRMYKEDSAPLLQICVKALVGRM
jgi:hypothetical protein